VKRVRTEQVEATGCGCWVLLVMGACAYFFATHWRVTLALAVLGLAMLYVDDRAWRRSLKSSLPDAEEEG
jgi:hypothetical protein